MQTFHGAEFEAQGPWQGPDIAALPDAVVKLRWTDQPFEWHTNAGEEVFVVLDGRVDMHVRPPGGPERVVALGPGDILHIGEGEAHVAHPQGPARVLVIEGRHEP